MFFKKIVSAVTFRPLIYCFCTVDLVESQEAQNLHIETLIGILMTHTTGTDTYPHPLPMTDTGRTQNLTTEDPFLHPHPEILTSEKEILTPDHPLSTMVVDHPLPLQWDPGQSKLMN